MMESGAYCLPLLQTRRGLELRAHRGLGTGRGVRFETIVRNASWTAKARQSQHTPEIASAVSAGGDGSHGRHGTKKPNADASGITDLDQKFELVRAPFEELKKARWAQLQDLRQRDFQRRDGLDLRHAASGMRGIVSGFWDTSHVHPQRGLHFRSLPLVDCIAQLPRPPATHATHTDHTTASDEVQVGPDEGVPMVESLMHFLLAGEIPSSLTAERMCAALRADSSSLPMIQSACRAIESLPAASAHPMAQLGVGLLAAQQFSRQLRDYSRTGKNFLWALYLSDGLSLLQTLPFMVAFVCRRRHSATTNPGHTSLVDEYLREVSEVIDMEGKNDLQLDFAGRLLRLTFGTQRDRPRDSGAEPISDDFRLNGLRLFLLTHADHSFNVSANVSNAISSAHGDPFVTLVASVCALAAPLHGGASEQVLLWHKRLQDHLAAIFRPSDTQSHTSVHTPIHTPTHTQAHTTMDVEEAVREHVRAELKEDRVIPGFGHAVMRCTDPRFTLLSDFMHKHLHASASDGAESPLTSLPLLNRLCASVINEVLTQECPKVRCPFPNVDFGSGVLLQAIGFEDPQLYPLLFATSRAFGVVAANAMNRALRLPIFRPNSVTFDQTI